MNDKNEQLRNYLRDYWEERLKCNPTFATYIGDHRYDNALEDLSEESIAAEVGYYRDLLSKTEEINETLLTPEDRLNCNIFESRLRDHIRMYDYGTHYIPLNQLEGPHIDFPQLTEFHPFNTGNDFENYVARLNAFPCLIDQVIENLQKGIEHKMTAFRRSMERVTDQIRPFTELAPEGNPLFSPVLKMKDHFSEKEIKKITDAVREAISTRVTPAYVRLYKYLSKEYMRYCREQEGIWALPDGMDMYRFFTRYHTTTDLSPEEIHEIGKREVEKIGSEMKKIMQKIGFSGSVRGFADYVRGRKELYPKTKQEILDGYRDILARMDKKLHDFFGRLPKVGYDLKEIETYREEAAPAAYYYPPPRDSSRPAYYYANTYKPEQRPKFIMEALSYHEAVPGHHLQIAIMQEQEDIPDFRKYEGSTAFIEGWALYAEGLAKEMGFYQDDYSEYGRITQAMWRAVRLVVDTGIHFYKWSRDQSIDYFRESTGLGLHELEVEVDRYIVMPGQALAYKIGELKIVELRERAKKTLGPTFDIREFHDRLLENGALPLNTLESVMNGWMNGKRNCAAV